MVNLDTAEGVDSTLMQQVQLYNVALKQEDGEPVTEEEVMRYFLCVSENNVAIHATYFYFFYRFLIWMRMPRSQDCELLWEQKQIKAKGTNISKKESH